MTFVYDYCLTEESKVERDKYIALYFQKIPPALHEEHCVIEGMRPSSLVVDRDRNMALLCFYPSCTIPSEEAPGSYFFVVDDCVVLIHAVSEGLFFDLAAKVRGIRYKLMPFNLPASLMSQSDDIKKWLIEAFECWGKSESNQFTTITEVQVMFNQQYVRPTSNWK